MWIAYYYSAIQFFNKIIKLSLSDRADYGYLAQLCYIWIFKNKNKLAAIPISLPDFKVVKGLLSAILGSWAQNPKPSLI